MSLISQFMVIQGHRIQFTAALLRITGTQSIQQWNSKSQPITIISDQRREYTTDRDGYSGSSVVCKANADGRRIYQVVARPVWYTPAAAQQVRQFGGLTSTSNYSESNFSLPRQIRHFGADIKATKRKMVNKFGFQSCIRV